MDLILCLAQIPQLVVAAAEEQVIVMLLVIAADREEVVEETDLLLERVVLEHQDKEIVVPIQMHNMEVEEVEELVQVVQELMEEQVLIGNLLVLFTQVVVVLD
jgi:hypothetical protein